MRKKCFLNCVGFLKKSLSKYVNKAPNINVLNKDFRLYNGTILVALDGAWSSVNLLDWLFNNYLHLNYEYNIILIGHPDLPVKSLLKKTINNLPENISISYNTLEYDLCHCFCVLYRHSSVGLQSLINGLPAIHLNIDLPINGDPISNYMNANFVVNDVNELNLALLKIKTLTHSELYSLKLKSREYSNTYFTPPNRKSHKMILS